MTLYLNTVTGEYPRHPGDIALIVEGWKVGDVLPTSWVEVTRTEQPEVQEGHHAHEVAPTLVNGVWTQTFEVQEYTSEELEFFREFKEKQEAENVLPPGGSN